MNASDGSSSKDSHSHLLNCCECIHLPCVSVQVSFMLWIMGRHEIISFELHSSITAIQFHQGISGSRIQFHQALYPLVPCPLFPQCCMWHAFADNVRLTVFTSPASSALALPDSIGFLAVEPWLNSSRHGLTTPRTTVTPWWDPNPHAMP